MGLFGLSKKERDLKALSEKEIQLRLYGHLRAPHAASHDKGAIASNKPIRPVILGPQVRTFDERKTAPAQNQNVTVEEAPSHHRSASVKTSKENTDDLFSVSTGEHAKPKAYPQDVPRQQVKTPAAPVQPRPSAASAGIRKPGFFGAFGALLLNKVFPVIFLVLKTAVSFTFQLLAALIGFISSSLLKVDFKNPRVRRIFSWTLGIGIIVFLFVGIHILNLKREVAMKHPKKISVTKPVKKKKDIIPQQVAVQTLAAETAAVSETDTQNGSTVSSLDTAAAETPAQTPAVQKGQVIQIATFAVLSDAEKLVAKLKLEGWPCFAKPLVRSGGKTYFCVFLGAFKTYQEAETKLAEFKKKEISKSFQDAFIRSL